LYTEHVVQEKFAHENDPKTEVSFFSDTGMVNIAFTETSPPVGCKE
jgi:hypothetical protein